MVSYYLGSCDFWMVTSCWAGGIANISEILTVSLFRAKQEPHRIQLSWKLEIFRI
jgi:hypothetical protein